MTQLLIEFHEYVIDKKDGELNPEWFVDTQSLNFALKILQTVNL